MRFLRAVVDDCRWFVADERAIAPEVTMADLLTELQAIRGLLEQQSANVALCPHGATGLCMDCISPLIEFHAADLVRQITNQAWEATRRGR